MMPRGDPQPAGLHPDHLHLWVILECIEEAHRVAAATDTGDQVVGQPLDLGGNLRAGLPADAGLEVAHPRRVEGKSPHRAEPAEGPWRDGDPIPHRLIDSIPDGAAV